MATKVEVDNITDAWRLGVTAAQIEEAAAKSVWQSNPNLLDNWYFANPVNQRGQTEYKTNSYTIDRWKSSASSSTIAIADGCIDFTIATSGQSINQPLEHWEGLKGKTITASMLLAAGATARVCIIVTGGTTVRGEYVSSGISSVTATIPVEATNVYIALQANAVNSAVKLIAAKLELGTQQTLAHQETDENWVLNEVPNYAEELAKCQRYQAAYDVIANGMVWPVVAMTTTAARVSIPLPAVPRAHPTPVFDTSNLVLTVAGTDNPISAVSQYSQSGNEVTVTFTSSGLTAGQVCFLKATANTKIIFDANL